MLHLIPILLTTVAYLRCRIALRLLALLYIWQLYAIYHIRMSILSFMIYVPVLFIVYSIRIASSIGSLYIFTSNRCNVVIVYSEFMLLVFMLNYLLNSYILIS